jgi:outer membrane protein TolC
MVSAFLAVSCFAQDADAAHKNAPPATSLSALLKEAEQNNPQIRAAQQGTQAAREVPPQVTALPDPMFQLQQVNVGSPRPFAGYSNSEFSYIGLGASQDIPYPGKLKLKGEIAKRDADIAGSRADSVSLGVLAEIKTAYYQLAYLSQTLDILNNDQQVLRQVERAADARYRSGMGNQQDILQAQPQQTKLLRDISMHHLEEGKLQARLKQLVNRPQSSPDIRPVVLKETSLPMSFDEILAAAQAQNPDLAATQHTIDREALQVEAARKDFKPDFNIQGMWQRTDPTQYRAYYQFTFGVKIPSLRQAARRTRASPSGVKPGAQRPRGAITATRSRPPRAVCHCRAERRVAQNQSRGTHSRISYRIPGGPRRVPEQSAGFSAVAEFISRHPPARTGDPPDTR